MLIKHVFCCLSAILAIFLTKSRADPELKCLVCRKVIEEIEAEINKIDPKKKIQVGSYRIDPKGNQMKNEIPYARSEVHMHDVLESVCGTMDDYAQAKYKDTGERTIIKLMSDNQMNPEMSKVNITPDPDLNKRLKYYCESLIEDHEDDILRIFTKSLQDPDIRLCTSIAGYCDDRISDDDDYTFEDRDEL